MRIKNMSIMNTRKILYIGIFSGSNIGDLVISNNIYEYLKKKYLHVDCMDIISLRKINLPGTDITIANNDKMKYKVYRALYANDIFRRIYNGYLEIILIKDTHESYAIYKKIVQEYDLICIGGGNLLMSIMDNRLAMKLNVITKIAKAANKKIFIMSVGAGPILLNKSKKLFKDVLENVDYITTRDEYSRSILKNELYINKKIDISGDPALLLDCNDFQLGEHNLDNDDTINISISIMPFGKKGFPNLSYYKDHKYYLDMYKHMVEYLYGRDSRYVFYLFSTELSDYQTILELYNYIINNSKNVTKRNLKIEYVKSLSDLLNFYRGQNLLIGTRMHSLIIGFTQSLPIISISWQKKVDSFMTYVDLTSYCYQLNNVDTDLENIYINIQQLLKFGRQNNKNKLIYMRKIYDDMNSCYISA